MRKVLRPSGGHILDIDAFEVADQFLTLANNVNTRKGYPSRIGGRRIAYPVNAGAAPNDPLHLLNIALNDFNWWMHFGADTIYGVEAGNMHDISYSGQQTVANTYEWVTALLNGIPVFTNGKDPLLYWDGDGGNAAAAVPDWPVGQVCKAVATFRFHVFAMNIDNSGGVFENLIVWSDAAEPGTLPASWTPAASNEAGSAILADTPGRCICGVPLGTQLMIYKPTSMYAMEYIGQQPDNIFSARPIVRSTGALSPHCVIEMGRHLVVGNDDIVLTDGVNTVSIAENRIKTFLANQIDETNQQNAFVVRDINKREVWVCVPEAGNTFATVAHVWDERRDTWTTRSLNQVRHGTTGIVSDADVDTSWDSDSETWDSDSSVWNSSAVQGKTRVVIAEPNQIYVEDTSDLVSVTGRLIKQDLTFGDDTLSKVTSRVWIEGSGRGLTGMQFRLGARASTDEDSPIAWGPYVTRKAGGTPYEVSGRYISIEIVQTGTVEWTVDRISIEAEFNGAY